MLALATPLTAAILCTSLPLNQGEEMLVAVLARVEEAVAEGEHDRARAMLLPLIEAHRGERYGLAHLPAIEDAWLAIEFAGVYREPDPRELVSGELVDFHSGSGSIELRYTPDDMEDFIQLRLGGPRLYVHPAMFDGPYAARIRGASYPRVVNSAGLPAVYAGLFSGNHVVGTWGTAQHGEQLRVHAPAVLAESGDDGVLEELARREKSSLVGGEPFDLRIEVGSTNVTLYDAKRKLVSGRAGKTALGRIGFRALPEFETLELRGSVEPAWMQGLLDADRELQRERWTRGVDLDELLEGWLPLPDLASLGLGKRSSEGELLLARDVERALEKSRHGNRTEALDLLRLALEEDPGRADLWYARTALQLGAGHRAEALESIREAIEQDAYTQELHELNGLLLRARRGPDWSEVFEERSDHYVVRSDIGLRVCLDAARVLESSYERFSHRLGDVDMGDEPFRVYLFAGEAGYHRYARGVLGGTPENTAGVYSPALGQLLIWNVPERSEMMQTVRHEGFHQFFDRLVGDAPTWLNEGLAEYYENADFTKGRSRQIQPHPEHLRTLAGRKWKLVELEEFVRQEPEAFYAGARGNYAQAWLLVHYLQESGTRERALLERLVEELAATEDSAAALEAAFEGVDYTALERSLGVYVRELSVD